FADERVEEIRLRAGRADPATCYQLREGRVAKVPADIAIGHGAVVLFPLDGRVAFEPAPIFERDVHALDQGLAIGVEHDSRAEPQKGWVVRETVAVEPR